MSVVVLANSKEKVAPVEGETFSAERQRKRVREKGQKGQKAKTGRGELPSARLSVSSLRARSEDAAPSSGSGTGRGGLRGEASQATAVSADAAECESKIKGKKNSRGWSERASW